MSTREAIAFLFAAWVMCAALSARSFIQMFHDVQRRTGRSLTSLQKAWLITFWPITWIAVAYNTIARGDEE